MPGLMILSATVRWTGCGLLGHEDDAHAAFADLLEQLVAADDRAGVLGEQGVGGGRLVGGGVGAAIVAVDGGAVVGEQLLDAAAEGAVAGAGLFEMLLDGVGGGQLQRGEEDRPGPIGIVVHADNLRGWRSRGTPAHRGGAGRSERRAGRGIHDTRQITRTKRRMAFRREKGVLARVVGRRIGWRAQGSFRGAWCIEMTSRQLHPRPARTWACHPPAQ